ncbi:MAG: HlyD family secretion protein [Planctomycetes bacterium]|nr:HlyD family secretion protein [Planctomycetota bacterium]
MTRNKDAAFDLVIEAGAARGERKYPSPGVPGAGGVVTPPRASVWAVRKAPHLLTVSGNVRPDPKGAFVSNWSTVLHGLKDADKAGPLAPERFANPDALHTIADQTGGLSTWWTPLPGRDLALLFERWGEGAFSPDEGDALERLAAGYAVVRPGGGPVRRGRVGSWLWRLVALAAVVAVLALVRLPLRVVAECEVAPREPRIVPAPMDGVVEDVLVAPGAWVEAGTVLAEYDTRLMEEELNISRRQVEVVEAQLASAMARGFTEARSRGDIALLEARLAQERARLQAMEIRYARKRIVAPVSGMVQLDDARAWRGRPVATGQAILWLVQPDDTRIDLWLPQDDRIDIAVDKPVGVHLYALGGEPRLARLRYVSPFAGPGPDGIHAFPAEADWLDESFSPPLGLRGTAFLYGDEVSLGYWLLRRPLAWTRRWLGV